MVPPVTSPGRPQSGEADYARLLDAAHQQLGGPLVLVWDNLNTHVSRAMRELIAGENAMETGMPNASPAEDATVGNGWGVGRSGVQGLLCGGMDSQRNWNY